MSELKAKVNGQMVSLAGISAYTSALDWLRDAGFTACKEGCAEGECGACAILVARPGIVDGTDWLSVDACLVPAASLDGQEVVTAEGLAGSSALHPVQQEMAARGGSQCGYCTPGFVCSMAAEYYRRERQPAASADQIDAEQGPNGFDLQALSGNLCRCTGYRPIRDAAYALDFPDADDPLARRRDAPAPKPQHTKLHGPDGDYVRPASLAEALEFLQAHPQAQVVAGSTDWGVDVNLKGTRSALILAVDRLAELRDCIVSEHYIELGAALTLTEIQRRLDGQVPLLDRVFPQFASMPIRNSATLGGNLGTASPIGDTPPALLALDAELVLVSAAGERVVPLADYFTGYRQSVRRATELIKSVRVPLPLSPVTAFHKIAKRRFDDISSVAIGMALDVQDGVIEKARVGLGGVAATPMRARDTETALLGQDWSAATINAAARVMAGEGTPMDDHRASAHYRVAMLGQSLLKAYAQGKRPN